MNEEDYIIEQFREMVGMGYSVAETIASLEEDEDVDQDLLKELVKRAY